LLAVLLGVKNYFLLIHLTMLYLTSAADYSSKPFLLSIAGPSEALCIPHRQTGKL